MFHSHSVTEPVSTLVTTEVSYVFFHVCGGEKTCCVSSSSPLELYSFYFKQRLRVFLEVMGGPGTRREQSPGVDWPSSHARPRNRCSLVVSASRESHTDESTSRLRAVPKVTKLLSAMAGSQRGHQTVQAIKSEEARGWGKKKTEHTVQGREETEERRAATRWRRRRKAVKRKEWHTTWLHRQIYVLDS